MAGSLLLCGGGEFQKGNEAADRRAIELAGGPEASIIILATAGGADGGGPAAARRGVEWFSGQGARRVRALPVVTAADANNPDLAGQLSNADLIYLAGGNPLYLRDTLNNSLGWQAIRQAYNNGAVLAGASAGAMVLMEHLYNPDSASLLPALNLLPGTVFAPHFNSYGRKWVDKIRSGQPQALLIGVDERVAIIGRDNDWQVFGRGWVTIYRPAGPAKYQGGQPFKLRV